MEPSASSKGPTYPGLSLKNVAGLEGKAPGDECMVVCKVRVTSIQVGKDYGDEAGKDKTVTTRMDVLEAGTKPSGEKNHDDYAKEGSESRLEKVKDIINSSKGDED